MQSRERVKHEIVPHVDWRFVLLIHTRACMQARDVQQFEGVESGRKAIAYFEVTP